MKGFKWQSDHFLMSPWFRKYSKWYSFSLWFRCLFWIHINGTGIAFTCELSSINTNEIEIYIDDEI